MFQYQVTDGLAVTTQTVTITNDAPVIADRSFNLHWTQSLNIDLSALGATDPNGDSLTYSHGTPSRGSCADTGNVCAFTASASDAGQTSLISFTVSDGSLSSTKTISVSITNTVPVANNDVFNTTCKS